MLKKDSFPGMEHASRLPSPAYAAIISQGAGLGPRLTKHPQK